jgi:nucleotide-binding universal stress UspA family protein
MFQKIMVATVGSPWSGHADAAANRQAHSVQEELLIVHVLEEDPQFQAPELDPSDPQMREQMEATGDAIVRQAANQAQRAGMAYHTAISWGSIAEEIVQTAEVESCDLIVMGTRHITGDKRLMTGRICNEVIATAPCPVLVVPFVQ